MKKSTPPAPSLESIGIEFLIPYVNNARKHSDEQVAQIAASIKEFGFNNPVLIDGDNGIIAGHGRVLAARKLEMTLVPVIRIRHLTDAQRRAYILADNRLAETGGGWNEDLLKAELDRLTEEGFNVGLTGFDAADIEGLGGGDEYTRKVEAPTYEPKGEKPAIAALYDETKTRGLIDRIESSNLPEDEKRFLIAAAHRHTIFNFENIAEYYAHADADAGLQELFEDSALVIIDFGKAIEQGFVVVSEGIRDAFKQDNPTESDDEE